VIALSGYTAVFDRSADDEESSGGTVVAGFATTNEQWALWEKDWISVLRDFNVPYFHMREFNSGRHAFSGCEWRDEARRRYFIAQLVATIKKWVWLTVGGYMTHQLYREANRLCEVDKSFNPFAECGRVCVLKVRDFIRGEWNSELPISYVFDQGDDGKGMLIDLMRRCDLPSPIFRRSRSNPAHPERDLNDPPMIQLQSADLLSWELRRWKIDYSDGEAMRKSLKAFTDMEHIVWKECTDEDMARVIHSIGIPRRAKNSLSA
jgi:hypothetical protein